jgi:hypothetical protein
MEEKEIEVGEEEEEGDEYMEEKENRWSEGK